MKEKHHNYNNLTKTKENFSLEISLSWVTAQDFPLKEKNQLFMADAMCQMHKKTTLYVKRNVVSSVLIHAY